jgi:hypothetical protein
MVVLLKLFCAMWVGIEFHCMFFYRNIIYNNIHVYLFLHKPKTICSLVEGIVYYLVHSSMGKHLVKKNVWLEMKFNVNVCISHVMYNVNIAFLFLGSQPRLMYDKVGRVN